MSKMYTHLMYLLGARNALGLLSEARAEQESRKWPFNSYDRDLWNKYLRVTCMGDLQSAEYLVEKEFPPDQFIPPGTLWALLDIMDKTHPTNDDSTAIVFAQFLNEYVRDRAEPWTAVNAEAWDEFFAFLYRLVRNRRLVRVASAAIKLRKKFDPSGGGQLLMLREATLPAIISTTPYTAAGSFQEFFKTGSADRDCVKSPISHSTSS
ncbi:hypothetical protein HDV00_011014 [Rhizophlyctis rosea]|nr:hypothetical protein HDV00_011014 [Rhizophlyctis rosea]